MRVTICAQFYSTGIFKEEGMFFYKEEINISDATWDELQKWVDDYTPYPAISPEDIPKYIEEIKQLDVRGVELGKRIREEWQVDKNTGEKIEYWYFSEALREEYLIP